MKTNKPRRSVPGLARPRARRRPGGPDAPPPGGPRLEVDIYQLVDDSLLKANRSDGTGWDWSWAELQRDWMDATPSRHAYRCLPLTIANQTGWWIRNPVGFSAVWGGRATPGDIAIEFDAAADAWAGLINNQFGEGILTWNTPFLFRTRPPGSRLLVCGPANCFIRNAHPLTAIIESDWMSMSFTMNWKIMTPGEPVRFDAGVPLFQAIPLLGNACADLEAAAVTYRKLGDDPEMARAYHDWHRSRAQYHEQKARGEVKGDGWQKDYFRGRDASGREAAPHHVTKVRPPAVRYEGSASPPAPPPVGGGAPEPREGGVPAQSAPPVRGGGAAATEGGPAAPGRVDDEWRRWIAENLLLEGSPESIRDAMVARGIDPEEAAREIEAARASPYLRGADRLRNRLRKRDWLLAAYRKLDRLRPASAQIERRERLPRDEFLRDYYATNRPVIITGAMDDWPALRKWGLDYFAERFGDREVEVQAGRDAGADYEIAREKYARRLRFGEFIEAVRSAGVTNDCYLTANNNSSNKAALAELWDDIGPLPEYLDGRDPMAGFLWFGPAGTITPFHHDLTNNFMAQVIGRKRVKVAPSWDLPLMANDFHVFSRLDGRVVPAAPRPGTQEPQILECLLGPGEILFLPVGCLHYVEGVEISVTVSFTNFLFDNDFASSYSTFHGV